MRVQAETEKVSPGHAASKRFTSVVLPEPEGAVIMMILPVNVNLNSAPNVRRGKVKIKTRSKKIKNG